MKNKKLWGKSSTSPVLIKIKKKFNMKLNPMELILILKNFLFTPTVLDKSFIILI